MPRKIGFSVAAVSSEDDLHPAEELNTHGPTVQGWWSARFCGFPQEVVLQLEDRVHVCKIQILSHQYIIASQLEILVGDVPDGQPVNHRNAKYKRLGYVTLSENEKTNFTARELKSVHVNAVGQFMKFIIPKNHINPQNLFNQVGLVAVNVIGDDHLDGSLSPSDGKQDRISTLDDLTFDMYQDPEVAQIIRKLDIRKLEAVKEEKFEHAKQLKVAIAELLKIGEKLGKYEVEKRQAIDTEDYDTARRKKAQMEEFRLHCYERLRVHELVGGKEFIARDLPRIQNGYGTRRDYEMSDSSSSEGFEGGVANVVPFSENRAIKPAKNAQGPQMSTYAAYEERALPTLRNGGESFDDDSDDARLDPRRKKTRKKSNLTEQDKRQMILPIEIFGSATVEHTFSKIYSQREEALRDVKRQVGDFEVLHSRVAPVRFLRAASMLVQKALKDIVLSVFVQALDVLKILLCEFPKQRKIPKSDIAYVVEKTLPEIHTKLGDKAARQRSAAHRYIMDMVEFPEVRALGTVPAHFCQPLAGNVQPRLAQGQVQLLEELVSKLGVEKDSGLSVPTVMAFAVPALQHPSGSVREAAERIIIGLYKLKGHEVRRYLPAEEERTRRNTLHRHLYEELDRIESEDRRLSITSTQSSHGDESRTSGVLSPDLMDKLEKLCIFCGERNDTFTSAGLDLHYWKSCPMLTRCTHCDQVVEISGLTDHILTECSVKDQYAKCNRCHATLKKSDYDVHAKLKACKVRTEKMASRCPLCHKNITPGDSNWKRHLMGIDGCEKNPRKKRDNNPERMKRSQSAARALGSVAATVAQPSRISRSMSRSFHTPAFRN